jgi:hypothetical protein
MHIYQNVALHYFERIIQSMRILLSDLGDLLGDDCRFLAVDHSYELVDPTQEDPAWCAFRVDLEFFLYFFTLCLGDDM